MESVFGTCEFVWSGGWDITTALGCLSLSGGEREDEGSFRARWNGARLEPSPQSSPLQIRGERKGSAILRLHCTENTRRVLHENRRDR